MKKLSDGLVVLAMVTGCEGYSHITMCHCPFCLTEKFCQTKNVPASLLCHLFKERIWRVLVLSVS